MKIVQRILKAKHWQIFGLIILLPYILLFTSFWIMMQTKSIIYFNIIFPIVQILFIIGFFAWLWSVGIGLQKKIPKDIKMEVESFKIFVIVPVIAILFYYCFSLYSNFAGFLLKIPLYFFLII